MGQGIQVLWQTGQLDYDKMTEVARPYGNRVRVMAFIDEMTNAYKSANLAVSRSGAMTIAELHLFAVPAIFVPLATSSENHQEVNARAMVREGWARMILQQDLDADVFSAAVIDFIENPGGLSRMAKIRAARGAGDAADRVVSELIDRNLLRF